MSCRTLAIANMPPPSKCTALRYELVDHVRGRLARVHCNWPTRSWKVAISLCMTDDNAEILY